MLWFFVAVICALKIGTTDRRKEPNPQQFSIYKIKIYQTLNISGCTKRKACMHIANSLAGMLTYLYATN